MKRLVIAIDFDDVLVDLIAVVLRHYNETYGTAVQLYDYYNSDIQPWGVDSIEEASERFHTLTMQYHDELVPAAETVRSIKVLAKKHELHIVTGRRSELQPQTIQLVERYFPQCFSSVELTNYFTPLKRRTKGEVCQQLRADILIDDHLDHLMSVLSVGLKEVILFGDYPWNQGEIPTGIKRCNNWQSVEREIERIAG